ncbi:MAG: hypothetical protein IPK79_00065 [Vampirovibrionales bacterium]|nr:hypothetical protein [Vampirovibrionales bacterium]
MQIVPIGSEIDIPERIAVCPICGAKLIVESIDEWEESEDDDQFWIVSETGLHLTCSSSPSLDSDNWDAWFNWHFSMPYVDWLPIEMRVTQMVRERVRFVEAREASCNPPVVSIELPGVPDCQPALFDAGD